MYKQNIKEKFLLQFDNLDTRKVYETVFKKSEQIENKYNTDIMNFDINMLDKFIADYIKPKTKQSARTYCNILSSYIQWSIKNNLSKIKENPLENGQSYFEKFVKNQNSLYITKDEIDAIIFSLINAQDSFIIKALFEGIQGKQLSELVNLTIQDIIKAENENGIVFLYDGNKVRYIKIDKETITLAKIAHKESKYYKKNGEVDLSHNVKETLDLTDSNYILKPTNTNNNSNQITYFSIYNRLEMIKNLDGFEEYKDILTSKNIVRSGMLYEAYKMYQDGVKIDKKAIEIICEKYGLKYKWSLKDFLNNSTIEEVYDL